MRGQKSALEIVKNALPGFQIDVGFDVELLGHGIGPKISRDFKRQHIWAERFSLADGRDLRVSGMMRGS
jgi:hypothetical protein